MRRTVSMIGAAVGVVGLVLASAGVAGAARPGAGRTAGRSGTHPPAVASLLGTFQSGTGDTSLPARGGTVDSLNWAGYVVTPSSRVTSAVGTFTVPSAGLLPPGFAATWVGIGGYSSADLIQAGVAEDSLPSLPLVGPQYYAWYELLPNAETPLTDCAPATKGDAAEEACDVGPGQHVAVAIQQVPGKANTWRITELDAGQWLWSKTVSYDSSGSSAEWIQEAPTILVLQSLMAPVGTVAFGPTSTFSVAQDPTATETISAGDPTTIDLDPFGLFPEATPSALAGNGQSFDVCAYASSCPTPS